MESSPLMTRVANDSAVAASCPGVAGWGRPSRRASGRSIIPGAILVSAGLFCLVYGFSNAETHDWSSAATWGFLATGAALLAAFTWWQTRSPHPLLPLRVLLDRNRGASFISVLLLGAGMFGVFLFLTYYLQQTLSYTPIKTGLAFLPMIAALMIASTIATTVLVPRIGPKPIVPLGMGLAAAGMVWLTGLSLNSGYAGDIMPPLVVAGLGLATEGVRAVDAGVASAAVNTMQQVGGSLGTALLNTLSTSAVANYLEGRNPKDPGVLAQAGLEGYSTAYWWSAVFFAVGLVISAVLYRRGCRLRIRMRRRWCICEASALVRPERQRVARRSAAVSGPVISIKRGETARSGTHPAVIRQAAAAGAIDPIGIRPTTDGSRP